MERDFDFAVDAGVVELPTAFMIGELSSAPAAKADITPGCGPADWEFLGFQEAWLSLRRAFSIWRLSHLFVRT